MSTISTSFSVPAVHAAIPSQHDDPRPFLLKIAHLIISLFRQIIYSIIVLFHRLLSNPQRCEDSIEWKSDSQGLVVLLHGLRNDPACWYAQESLLSEIPQIDVFAPIVPKRGMCSLEEAAEPLLPPLLDYVRKNPGKPLCLLGTSNGGRLVTWLEIALRERAPQTPVLVSSVAGVHFGSRQMDRLQSFGLANCFYPSELQEELKYGSAKAQELLNRLRAPLPSHCAERSYEFYATTEDLLVDLESSLPELNREERFHIIHGQGHGSIVAAVAHQQIASCRAWIQRTACDRGLQLNARVL